MSKRVPVRVQAYALLLVEDGDRFLLIQEADPDRGQPWYFPAGGIEPNESLLDGAKREAREESGIEVELLGLLRLEQWGDFSPGSEEKTSPQMLRYFFLAKPIGGALKEWADEHSLAARWFTLEEIRTLKLRHAEVLERIEAYRRDPRMLPIESIFAGE